MLQCFISNFISFAILSISQLSHRWTDWCESDHAGAHVMGEKPRWKITICHFERVSFDPTDNFITLTIRCRTVCGRYLPIFVAIFRILFTTRTYSLTSLRSFSVCRSSNNCRRYIKRRLIGNSAPFFTWDCVVWCWFCLLLNIKYKSGANGYASLLVLPRLRFWLLLKTTKYK